MKIGIIAAIRSEAEPLANALDLSWREVADGNYHLWQNADASVVLLTPGEDADFKTGDGTPVGRPGKVSAAVITTILIELYKPDVIINAGTAAGIAAKGIQVGDIVVADYVANHDINIPLSGYSEYGRRKVALNQLNALEHIILPYKRDTVSSAESFTSTHEEWQTMTSNDVMAKEMEAAGVVQAAQILGYTQPIYIVKALTDHESEASSDKEQATDYEHNAAVAMKALTAFVGELVTILERSHQ